MKRAVILTGASSGLGASILESLLFHQIPVFSISRSDIVTKNIRQVNVDFSSPEDIESQLDSLFCNSISDFDDFFYIDNAGIIEPITQIGKMELSEIQNNLTINVISKIFIVNYLIKNLNSKLKLIINLTSGAANKNIDSWSLYSTSKLAMEGFYQRLKFENKQIEIINYDPGVVNTNMQQKIRNSEFEKNDFFKDLYNKNKLQSPKKVAERIVKDIIVK